jgi:hypothetical protein
LCRVRGGLRISKDGIVVKAELFRAAGEQLSCSGYGQFRFGHLFLNQRLPPLTA